VVQEKYQEEKACDKRTTTIIIIIISAAVVVVVVVTAKLLIQFISIKLMFINVPGRQPDGQLWKQHLIHT
jgi:hypothetical protein